LFETQVRLLPKFSSLITTEYAGNYIYEGGVLQFFNTAEGYVEPKGLGWEYVFQYKDHLGNIRLSYADADGNGLIAQTEIREENNYYPFGLKHKGYNNAQTGKDHKYGFGNKEEQDELGLGWIDITARNYDPALGRWMNLDPLAELMRRHSPYNYAFDNPVYFIDADGNLPQPGKQETDATRSQREELDKQKKQEDIQKALGFLVDKGVIKNDTSSGTSGEAKVGSVEGEQGTFGAPISEDGGNSENFSDINSQTKQEESTIPWPRYFGQLRHFSGPDAIAISLDLDGVTVGGTVISPIGVLLVLKGPQKGSVEYIYDIGIAAGLDISVAGKLTELYFNGKTNDITKNTFIGFRLQAEIAVTVFGIDFGKGISYAPPANTFIKNAVFGISSSLGISIPAPVVITGNVSSGYTGSWDELIKLIGESLKK
jgi:RHS repeat-associated protein